jgi:hypothetical protein
MQAGTRVRMRDVGGSRITGTVRGPGRTTEIRPLDSAGDEDIPTAIVDWDDPERGSDTVAIAGLEIIDDSGSAQA